MVGLFSTYAIHLTREAEWKIEIICHEARDKMESIEKLIS
jgi:hypothetical protein